MNYQLVSLLPHNISIVCKDGTVVPVEPSGIIARCSQQDKIVGEVNGIPITKQVYGEVIDLPKPQEFVKYIVSRMVALACPDREDLLVTGPPIRNPEGVIVGCKGLSVVQ